MLHLQKVETKLIKTVHHIDFLSSTIDQEITLKGLACTVNVMEADAKTNRVIQDHIKKSVIGLMELIRGHYDTLETKFEKEKEVKEATIESLNNDYNWIPKQWKHTSSNTRCSDQYIKGDDKSIKKVRAEEDLENA